MFTLGKLRNSNVLQWFGEVANCANNVFIFVSGKRNDRLKSWSVNGVNRVRPWTYYEAEGEPGPPSHNMSRIIAAIVTLALNALVPLEIRGELGFTACEDKAA